MMQPRTRRLVLAASAAALLAVVLTAGIVIGATLAGRGDEPRAVAGPPTAAAATRVPPSATSAAATATPPPTAAGADGREAAATQPGSAAQEPAPAQPNGSAPAPAPTVPAAAPPPAAPPPEPAEVSAACAACGEPRLFCDTWPGGICNDYRQLGDTSFEVGFPPPSEEVTFDCFSSTDPGYAPTMNTQNAAEGIASPLAWPCAFSKHEHFMTRMEDGNFGMAVLRFQRPFDFAGRTGHVRFDIDLKTSNRRYVRVTLSPDLTKALTDDRSAADRRPGTALDIWVRNGEFSVAGVRDGAITHESVEGRYYGVDDVRDTVDVYVSRTSVRVDVNGTTYVNRSLPDLGFDRAYVYLSQVSYNPCKDGQCSDREQIFHWDNIAFDGPTLPRNALTPAGQRDVMFNAFRASSCTLRGAPAVAAASDPTGSWTTFVARLPDDGSAVGPADVACTRPVDREGWDAVQSFEIVRPG